MRISRKDIRSKGDMKSFFVFDSALPLKTELLSFINDFDHAPAEDKADRMKDGNTF